MTNKDKCWVIVNKIFELCENKDKEITFYDASGLSIMWGKELHQHDHTTSYEDFGKQLDDVIKILNRIGEE